eukprot:6613938-Prymnesium_polylepis.2
MPKSWDASQQVRCQLYLTARNAPSDLPHMRIERRAYAQSIVSVLRSFRAKHAATAQPPMHSK